ncbi:MAG: sulfate adenylyltransferase [Actinobacteria bacterium]|nr:sulfate adenylyltransferase [Actinomycetota bacterium]
MESSNSRLVPPYGGILKPLLLGGNELNEELKRIQDLPQVRLNSKETSDVVMLAMGAFSPLDGFLRRSDYLRVVEEMKCSNGTLWPIPVTVSVTPEQARAIREGHDVALIDDDSGDAMAVMNVEEIYPYDRLKEVRAVFGTEDEAHPGVRRIYSQGDFYLGGPVRALSEGSYPGLYKEFARPEETRRIFKDRGWSTVAAFQTRNPIHRSHEYLVRIAMEVCDGVLIHPIVGALKPGDIPADVRIKCYHALIDHYLPASRTVLKVYPMEMRYGGPREAVLHAIIRQNFGCSHLIIGRDHAGVGKYYGPFDAQEIFEQIPADSLQIKPLKLDWTFWCYKCQGMASMKTCPHEREDRLLISGTELRKMLSGGKRPPEQFSRPEVLEILVDYYKNNRE